MNKVLLIEDSSFFTAVVRNELQTRLGFEVACAGTAGEAMRILDDQGDQFFVGLVDLNLPDAREGEVVDQVIARGTPVIVFTAQFDERVRESILAKDIIDYVLKNEPASLAYLVGLVARIRRNLATKALVMDDSRVSRGQIAKRLRRHRFTVIEAASGAETLQAMAEHPDVRLVITDYHMPEIDGFQLTRRLRRQHSRDDLAIIGVSA